MAKKKSVKNKASKKSKSAKPAKKAKLKKKVAKKTPTKKVKKAAKPAKKAKAVKKLVVKTKPPKLDLKKAILKAKLSIVSKNPIKTHNPLASNMKGATIQRSSTAPVVVKPKPFKLERPKKVESTEPPEPVIPLKKIIKTFSIKNDSKDSGKKIPPHPNQYSIEYIIHASNSLLFEVISSPSGLSEWFADDVNIRDGNFTFFWDGSTQVARQIAYKQDKLVRFQWEGKPDYTFFEFRIETDDLTNDTSLIVTDFVEDGDKESARLLWDNQINKLRKAIGS